MFWHRGWYSRGVGIGERMSGKEFGENWKFKMAARGLISRLNCSYYFERISVRATPFFK
jgi:hypothetical protein